MKRIALALVTGLIAGMALAKLPPPTPQEQAQLEKKKEEKKQQTEKEKKALEQAQDRVAREYRAKHPQKGTQLPQQGTSERLDKADVPEAARHPENGQDSNPDSGPQHGRGGQEQGQAHSKDAS